MNANSLPKNGAFTFTELQDYLKKEKLFQFPEGELLRMKWYAEVLELKKKVGRQVRKDQEFLNGKFLSLFLHVVGYANYAEIDLQQAITKAYPGFCIYCTRKRCKCGKPGITRPISRSLLPTKANRVISVAEFQKMDWKVYPNDRSREAKLMRAMHLSEEGDEFFVELLRGSAIEKMTEEIGDFLERMISLASTFRLNLAKEVAKYLNAMQPAS